MRRLLLGYALMTSIATPTSLRTGRPVPDARTAQVPGGFEVTASSFLPRRVSLLTDAVELWPADELMPSAFTFEGAHGSDSALPITRPKRGIMTVEPSQDLVDDPAALDALMFGIANINSVYQEKEFSLQLVPPGSEGQIYVLRDPYDPLWAMPGYENAGAVAYAYLDSTSTVTGGRILFVDFEKVFWGGHLCKAMSHELAHIVGIRGHPKGIQGVAPDGVMSSSGEEPQEFTDPEQDLLRWLFRRPPGTRWPDDSIGLTERVASASVGVVVPLCRALSPRR